MVKEVPRVCTEGPVVTGAPMTETGRVDGAPVLTAQLRVPRVPRTLVRRDRLTRRLDALAHTPVAAVTGGAGWGKTTLLASWVRTARLPVAWVSVGPADDDPSRFWALVATALSGPAPEVTGPALADLLVGVR